MIKKMKKECYRRTKVDLQWEVNAKNKLEATSTLGIPVVTYSVNVVNWNLEGVKRIDKKIRKLMTLKRIHYPKADPSRMYIP